jgi:hypothetical protein
MIAANWWMQNPKSIFANNAFPSWSIKIRRQRGVSAMQTSAVRVTYTYHLLTITNIFVSEEGDERVSKYSFAWHVIYR